MASPEPDPLIGKRLGEYEVLERIGEGGMGVVYRGVQPIIKKRVAIKVLKPHAATDQVAVQRLIDEAEAVNSIRHRGIIDIFSLGRLSDGRPYIVMEYLEGQPLDVYLASNAVPLDDALTLIGAICGPLGAAHRAKVVHRDLKPSNVFICETDGERYLKLLDFGIAKKNTDGTSEVSKIQRVIGTPNYMAPEQARNEQIGPATDLYALGVMAFEMVTGLLPYRGSQPLDVIMAHMSDPVPSARDARPGVSDRLDELIQRLMAKSPEDRPASAEAVQRELLAISSSISNPSGLQLSRTSIEAPAVTRDSLTIDSTLLSPRTLERDRKTRNTLGILVAVLTVAVLATFLITAGTDDATPLEVDAGTGLAIDAGAPSVPDAGTSEALDAMVPPTPIEVDAGTSTEPRDAGRAPSVDKRTPKPRDTEAALLQRIGALEKSLRRATPSGDEPDPAAIALLRKYRLQATTAQTPAERAALAKTLDDFQSAFIRR